MTKEEICDFVRWKVGAKNQDERIITQYGQTISRDAICSLINIKKGKITDTEDLYSEIVNEDIDYLGSVYTLALVSLFKKGEEPIYDKFAWCALQAIKNNINIGEEIQYEELPEKFNIRKVIEKYNEYKDLLVEIFEKEWEENRDIDRALWTYGHMFDIKKLQ